MRSVEHFLYPNERPVDFDWRAKELLDKVGHGSASITIEDLNHHNTDCFELRRVGASFSLAELVPKISGFNSFVIRTVGMLSGVKERSAQRAMDNRSG